jgi:putative oxidoreductase
MADVLQRDEGRGAPGSGSHTPEGDVRIDHVGRTGIYPASGPHPELGAELRGQGELGHPEERRPQRLLTSGQETTGPLLAGRALLGGFFLYNGINHFRNSEMLTAYAQSKGVPAAGVAVAVTGAMLVAGGSSLLTGIRPKIGAALASAFLAGVSPVMHAFWREEDPQQQMAEMVNFTKNVALIGGALFAAAVPEPWRYAPRTSS